MSNNNPHLNQTAQSSSWNPLQLEHSMNPLPYVCGPPPFDLMDLSLQSNRSSSSPLSKSAHALVPSAQQLEYAHKQAHHQLSLHQQQQYQQGPGQQPMHGQSSYPIHNLSASAAQQQTASALNPSKFMSANGSDREQSTPVPMMQTSQSSALSSSNIGNYQRHSAESFAKLASQMGRNYENDPHSKSLQKPVELVNKDCSYNAMISSKLPPTHLQQQQTSKKHSPLRSGGVSVSGGGGSYHIPQSPQQPPSPFSSTAPVGKHNGPHTPPTPLYPIAAPSIQQQLLMHSGNTLDYNQLHLQQTHSSYPQAHLQQQQPHQQHLHHAYTHSQHHEHWQQQLQQQPLGQPVSLASHYHQQHMQHTQLNSPHHIHQQQQSQPTAHLHKMEPSSPPESQYAETNFEQRDVEHESKVNVSPKRLDIPDSAESPDTNASSNDEEYCLAKAIRERYQLKGCLPSLKVLASVTSSRREENLLELGRHKVCNKSPKGSPRAQHKSPIRSEVSSTESLDLSSQRSALHSKQIPSPPLNAPSPIIAAQQNEENDTERDRQSRQTSDVLKNGRTPPTHAESIDKIAEMIAKTASNCSNSNSNSNSSNSNCNNNSNSNDAQSNSSSKSSHIEQCESPKTKKQRQVLKLRNAEHNSDQSTNSSDSTPSLAAQQQQQQQPQTASSIPLASNDDDNAVLAEELRKGARTPPLSPRKRAISPQTNSRSSSSSSSSSSCSNSSRSCGSCVSCATCAGKQQKFKQNLTAEPSAPSQEAKAKKLYSSEKENVRDSEVVQLKVESDPTEENQPLNLNFKAPAETIAKPASSEKSTFEEVENKLEEMFAGIEDEMPPENKPIDGVDFEAMSTNANEADAAADLSAALQLSNSLKDCIEINKSLGATKVEASTSKPTLTPTLTPTPQPQPPPTATPTRTNPRPIQTKAAKKSTVPSPIKVETPSPAPAPSTALADRSTTEANKSTTSAAPSARKPPPRRRLSVALDPSNLRIMFENNEEPKEKKKQKRENSNDRSKQVIVQMANKSDDTNKTTTTTTPTEKSRTSKGNKSTNSSTTTTASNTSNSNSNSSNSSSSNSTTPSKTRNAGSNSSTSSGGSSTKTSGKPNASVKQKNKQNQQKQLQPRRRKQSSSDEDNASTPSTRESATTSISSSTNGERYKSPFVLIKRDGTVTVVNAATSEENGNEKQTKNKTKHERRSIRGFHSSTLSQKYDADTTDSTWICVFCKRGPHRMGLGDLFGPYVVTSECEEYKNVILNASKTLAVDAEFVSKRRRIDMVQCNASTPPVVQATKALEALTPTSRPNKKKKKVAAAEGSNPPAIQATSTNPLDIGNETFLGMNKTSEKTYEVWLHEDCIVWAPDVHLVGARIMGLDGAVWNSIRFQCMLCMKSGASVCCLERNCKAIAHIPCAREASWSINEINCHVYCQEHVKRHIGHGRIPPATATTSAAVSVQTAGAVKIGADMPSTSVS